MLKFTSHFNVFLILACMKWTKEDDYKRRNISFKNMANGTAEDKSLEEHSTIWSTVFVTEFILISIINTFTIIETVTYASTVRT